MLFLLKADAVVDLACLQNGAATFALFKRAAKTADAKGKQAAKAVDSKSKQAKQTVKKAAPKAAPKKVLDAEHVQN